ncbi:MAG: CvpA family protein [Lachnospiraceae bacterium]|nr:CvpA family protein [Lachnospiraceae bacterium]
MSIIISGIVLLILIGAALRGYHRGFLRTALSMLSLILTVILVGVLQPYMTDVLREYTPLESAVEKAVYANLETAAVQISGGETTEALAGTVTAEEQVLWLEECNIPSIIQEEILRGTEQAAEAFALSASQTVADIVMNVLGYLITFFLVFAILHLLGAFFHIVEYIPILHGVDKWLGAVLGLVQGLIAVWILCLAVTLNLPSEAGSQILAAIEDSALLSFLYNGSLFLSRTL